MKVGFLGAVFVFAMFGAASPAFASTKLVSSSADSFSGGLVADGFTTTIGPFALRSGFAPPAYDHTTTVASFGHLYELTPAELNNLSLQVQATHMVDTAKSAGIGVDEIGASGTAVLGSANFLLTDTLWSTLTALGLSVSAIGISSDSNSSFVFGPNLGFLNGDASFRSLAVTGALVGGKTLTFSGDAAANTVLYSSSTVTITLDKQTLLLPPAATSGIIGPSITTDAIDIRFNGAKFAGQTISGHFDIGQSSASYALMRPMAFGVFTAPEPSTWAMVLLGFAGLGCAGYRRARAGLAS
jgi:hypothetical protein